MKYSFFQILKILPGRLKRFVKENLLPFLMWILIAIMMPFFILSQKYKLIFGGILLSLFGINYFILALKQKKTAYFLWGTSSVYMGIVSFFTYFLLPGKIDHFIFMVYFAFVCWVIFYLMIKRSLNPIIQILISLLLTILGSIMTLSLNSIIVSIYEKGFSAGTFYLTFMIYLVLIILVYFVVVSSIFYFIKKNIYGSRLFNNYFYLGLAIMFATLFGGYFYLMNISQDKLRDFFIILSAAFVTSFAGVSAIKSLEEKEESMIPSTFTPINIESFKNI